MTFRIGVDGGGSKTECILVDEAGLVVTRHAGPGCNPSLVGPERARALLDLAISSLLAGSNPPVSHLLLCLAGSPSFWQDVASGYTAFGCVKTLPDSWPVLELATGGGAGLAIHAGTGSFVGARAPDGSTHTAGGLGWRFGDPGSGHDIGRRAIAAALIELQVEAGDPPGANTRRPPLAEALCQHCGLDAYGALSRRFYLQADADAVIADFAPRVVDLAGRGCETAKRVIIDSIAGFGPLVLNMVGKHFPTASATQPTCGVSGRLLNQPPCLGALRHLAAAQSWPVLLQPVTEPPVEGVRRLLMKMD